MYKKPAPNPGKKKYADLKENIVLKGLGEDESPQIEVKDGLVTFSRYKDVDERVSFTISEWDLGEFIDIWLYARMEQSHPREQKAEIR